MLPLMLLLLRFLPLQHFFFFFLLSLWFSRVASSSFEQTFVLGLASDEASYKKMFFSVALMKEFLLLLQIRKVGLQNIGASHILGHCFSLSHLFTVITPFSSACRCRKAS